MDQANPVKKANQMRSALKHGGVVTLDRALDEEKHGESATHVEITSTAR